jgi:hypothetical protein
MKHIILFENFFNVINESSSEIMKSGAKLYRNTEHQIIPEEISVTLLHNEASIEYNNKKKQKVYKILFTEDTKRSYPTDRGFGSKVVPGGLKEVSGAEIVFSTRDSKSSRNESLVTIPYEGKSYDDFSKALLDFLYGLDGGLSNLNDSKIAVNSIVELFHEKYRNVLPESLKMSSATLMNQSKLSNGKIIAGQSTEEKKLNENLKRIVKKFSEELA